VLQQSETELRARIDALLERAKTTDAAEVDELELDIPGEIDRREVRLKGTTEARVELTTFRGRLQAEVFSPFGWRGRRVVHRRRGACHAGADGGQPVFAARR
jgi:hypothetical protein